MSLTFANNIDQCKGIPLSLRQERQFCYRAYVAADAGIDCIDCLMGMGYEQQQSNPWVDALSAITAPLAFGSTYVGARFQYKGQRLGANAYERGHTECTSRFNSYLNYSIERGAPLHFS